MIQVLGTVLALALCVSLATAQEKREGLVEKREFDKTAPLDEKFLVAMNTFCNAMDRGVGLVEKRASSDKVKEFSKKLKEDHDQLSKDLGKAIKDKKLAAVAGLDKEVNAKLAALAKLEKAEFDIDFVKHVIAGHEKVIQMAEHQVAHGKDEDVTRFAKGMLPTLRDHVAKAKKLQKDG